MRVFGWLLILGGLAWAVIGRVPTALLIYCGFTIAEEEARNLSGGLGLVSLVVNGLIFVFPGLVVAGIGGPLARRPCCHGESVTAAQRAESEGRII